MPRDTERDQPNVCAGEWYACGRAGSADSDSDDAPSIRVVDVIGDRVIYADLQEDGRFPCSRQEIVENIADGAWRPIPTTEALEARYSAWLAERRKQQRPDPKTGMNFLSYDEMARQGKAEYLIDNLIFEKQSVLLFGPSNAFKSFLAIDMACSVATHRNWHGAETMGAPVLICATQGARAVAAERIPAWMDAHDVARGLCYNVRLYAGPVELDNPEWVDRFIDALTGYERPALIVFDIFGDTMCGSEVEDGTARAWVAGIERIMRSVWCSVLVVAHTGWGERHRARMHSHTWGAFHTRLSLKRAGTSMETVLEVERHKDAPSEGRWRFRMEPAGNSLVPVLAGEADPAQPAGAELGATAEKALAALRALADEHGGNVPERAWRSACYDRLSGGGGDARRKAFVRAKAELIEAGLVTEGGEHVSIAD